MKTSFHTATFILLSIFSLAETIGLKIWERAMSLHAKCSLPVFVRSSKTSLAQAPDYFLGLAVICVLLDYRSTFPKAPAKSIKSRISSNSSPGSTEKWASFC